MKKNLFIVCEDSEKKYATYLQQLVSSVDDEDGVQVGTKDGEVNASIFSEKKYEDNLHSMSSSNYILFLGDGKVAKSARSNMEEHFSEYGMHYGWLGRQAYMFADPDELKRADASRFQEICQRYGRDFGELAEAAEGGQVSIVEAQQEASGIAKAATGLARLALSGANAVATLAKDLSWDVLQKRDVRDQQYSTLTLALYMDGLSEFLGD